MGKGKKEGGGGHGNKQGRFSTVLKRGEKFGRSVKKKGGLEHEKNQVIPERGVKKVKRSSAENEHNRLSSCKTKKRT